MEGNDRSAPLEAPQAKYVRPRIKAAYRVLGLHDGRFGLRAVAPEILTFPADAEMTIHLLSLLKGRLTVDEIVEQLELRWGTGVRAAVLDGLEGLNAVGAIEDEAECDRCPLEPAVADRFSRNLAFFGIAAGDTGNTHAIARRLRDRHVCLLGLGGIGSYAVVTLMGLGIGRLRCVDWDVVESSNLNRQVLYREEDIGRLKTAAAEEALSSRSKLTRFEFVNQRLEGRDDVRRAILGVDFVLFSADRPKALWRWVNQACFDAGVPLSRCGYSGYRGYVGPLVVPGQTACLECFGVEVGHQPIPEPLQWINQQATTPSIAPLNAILANVQAWETVRYLGGLGNAKTLSGMWSFDLLELTARWIPCERNPECPRCGSDDHRRT